MICITSNVFATTMDDMLINGVQTNDIPMIKLAMTNGANINFLKDNGLYDNKPIWGVYTPIDLAIRGNYSATLVPYLITNGADVNLESKESISSPFLITPLIQAIQSRKTSIARILIEAGANVNTPIRSYDSAYTATSDTGSTPLIIAVSGPYITEETPQLIQLLLKKGADVNQADDNGNTPLMRIMKWNVFYSWGGFFPESASEQIAIVKQLLAAGANANMVNKEGKTALQFAVDYNKKELIYMFLPGRTSEGSEGNKGVQDSTVMKRDSERSFSLLNDSRNALAQKDFQRALSLQNEAISVDPENKAAYMARGNTYLNMENYTEAINDETKALSFDPQYAPAYVYRATAFLKSGDKENAKKDFCLFLKYANPNDHNISFAKLKLAELK